MRPAWAMGFLKGKTVLIFVLYTVKSTRSPGPTRTTTPDPITVYMAHNRYILGGRGYTKVTCLQQGLMANYS